MNTLSAIATGSILLLGANSPAQGSAELFASKCSGCHDNAVHPRELVYNAAGNAAIITAVNAAGMGATGSPADNISIATYLDGVKPTITLAPVAHDSPGTVISLRDIKVSAAVNNASLKIIAEIATVSAPTKGTVTYRVGTGFASPSTVTYKPFSGQSGTDTWTYQGRGEGLSAGLATTIRTASVVIAASAVPVAPNYTALWWNAAENGWGVNFTHQGSTIFGTIFTYDATGTPLWLIMSDGTMQSDGVTFSGELYRTTGPAFNASPFNPIGPTNYTRVGTMSVTFSGSGSGTLNYTVNAVAVSKAITRLVYGTRAANCLPSTASRASSTNYQDLWWNAAESGWGVNVTHQDNTLFATLFTYDATGKGLWLVMSGGVRQTDGSYLGTLYRSSGPAFNASPFTPITAANLTQVGTMRFQFADGERGTLTYTVDGISVTKAITRLVFSSPVPVCN